MPPWAIALNFGVLHSCNKSWGPGGGIADVITRVKLYVNRFGGGGSE